MSEVVFEQRPCGCGCGGAMVPNEDGRWFCLSALLAEDEDDEDDEHFEAHDDRCDDCVDGRHAGCERPHEPELGWWYCCCGIGLP